MRFENVENYQHPFVADMEPGTYLWCSCGRSEEAPFCDGSHEEVGLEPVEFTIGESRRVALCDCGLTQAPPFCDNTHATLEEEE
jgi:CDGSH-type Zn-finger protein